MKWTLISAVLLALVIVPFLLFGEQVDQWTLRTLDSAQSARLPVALILGGLLASDILLPVPSSMVSTACGLFLGFTTGTVVSLVGMVVSCVAGFWLAGKLGRPLVVRLVGSDDMRRFEAVSQRYGDWAIVLARPVPVLAEVSVLFAGMGRVPRARFLVLTTFANLGISAAYAAIGAFSANVNSFLIAFAAAILVPAAAMGLTRLLRRPSSEKG